MKVFSIRWMHSCWRTLKSVTELEVLMYSCLQTQLFELRASVLCCWGIIEFCVELSEWNVDRVYVECWCLVDKIE